MTNHFSVHTVRNVSIIQLTGKPMSGFTPERNLTCAPTAGRALLDHMLSKFIREFTRGERPYPCSDCRKSFYKLSDLKIHRRTHTREKPFKCSHCDKTFAISTSLKVHERMHTGEKPYCCSICDERFSFKWGFQTHKKIHAAPGSS